jgi:hypothetical protein
LTAKEKGEKKSGLSFNGNGSQRGVEISTFNLSKSGGGVGRVSPGTLF